MIPMVILMFMFGIPAFMMDFTSSFSPETIESLDNEEMDRMIHQFSALMPSVVLMNLLSIILPWLYYALMESSSLQGTLGKLAMASIVTDLDGDRVSFLRATGRYFGKIVSHITLLIGFLMAAFTERKQALHDLMAGCLVIQKESNIKPLYDLPE